MILPHGRELLEILPLSDIHDEFSQHERLMVFDQKGRVCVSCDRVGTLLILSRETIRNRQSRSKKTIGSVHIDLYTDDFVLMTVDHVIPKHQARLMGWEWAEIESLDNKQPMCDPCNNSKGNKLLTNQDLRQHRRNANKPIHGVEVIRSIVPNLHALLGDAL